MDNAVRLDAALVERGLISGRDAAKAAIRSGAVFLNGRLADKPSASVCDNDELELCSEVQRYVSRGGLKLEHALNAFVIDPAGRTCLDCGASAGGFTDCLLQNGASLVYAVDVGTNQLAPSLRADARVISRENVNARDITPEMFDTAPSLVTVDVSFISLALVLPAIRALIAPAGEVIALVKPQFEAGRAAVGKRGIVKDARTHAAVLTEFTAIAHSMGFAVRGITYSPARIPDGNIEFLAHLQFGGETVELDIKSIVNDAHRRL